MDSVFSVVNFLYVIILIGVDWLNKSNYQVVFDSFKLFMWANPNEIANLSNLLKWLLWSNFKNKSVNTIVSLVINMEFKIHSVQSWKIQIKCDNNSVKVQLNILQCVCMCRIFYMYVCMCVWWMDALMDGWHTYMHTLLPNKHIHQKD